jgi:fermentation-respiration switch protein FrsA (DUF1100 family)
MLARRAHGTDNFVHRPGLPWSAPGTMPLPLLLLLLFIAAYLLLALFYFLFQEQFIFVRFRLGRAYRFRFRYPFEERFITADDGATLHALYFPAEQARGVILYFHGNTGSLRRWGKHAPRLTKLGYDVLMPDHRGYGKSRGRLSEKALHADADRWYAHLRAAWPEQDIVLYGRSLGSGLATPLAAAHAPRMLLLETPFANLYDVAMSYLPILPYRLLLRYRFRNDLAIRRVKCPVYIFHGKRDTIVPYTSALKLYSLVPAHLEREMFTFPKGHHSDLARFTRFNRTMQRLLG